MSILEAIIQGIVQGLTEFLPVSSSGHLSLAQHIMGVELDSLVFDIILHVGTLIAVLAVYYKLIIRLIAEFFRMLKDIFTGKFSFKNMNYDRKLIFLLIVGLIPLFALFIPVPGTDMKLKDLSDMWATDSTVLVEGIAFLMTSTLLFIGIIRDKKSRSKTVTTPDGKTLYFTGRKKLRFSDAVVMGIAQCAAAVFPGLSRSGSTMSSGLIKGVNKQAALDYSFVLGIPAILAAAVLSLRDVSGEAAGVGVPAMIAGLVSSAVVGFLAIKLFKWLVSSDKLIVFAVYTLVLGVATIVVAIIEAQTGTNIFAGLFN